MCVHSHMENWDDDSLFTTLTSWSLHNIKHEVKVKGLHVQVYRLDETAQWDSPGQIHNDGGAGEN